MEMALKVRQIHKRALHQKNNRTSLKITCNRQTRIHELFLIISRVIGQCMD